CAAKQLDELWNVSGWAVKRRSEPSPLSWREDESRSVSEQPVGSFATALDQELRQRLVGSGSRAAEQLVVAGGDAEVHALVLRLSHSTQCTPHVRTDQAHSLPHALPHSDRTTRGPPANRDPSGRMNLVSKTGMGGVVHRGFESLPLRFIA